MVRFTRPLPGTGRPAVQLVLAVAIPSAIVTLVAGTLPGMAFGLAAGLTMAVSPLASTAAALGSAVLAAMLAAGAVLADEQPLAVAGLMLLSGVLLALTNQHSAGLMTLAPVIVVIFAPKHVDITWWQMFGFVLAGGIVGWLVITLLKFTGQPQPVPRGVAWRHGLVIGVLSAAAMYWALANDISHGYWIAITLVLALRPLPEQRSDTLQGRLLGTLLGAVIAFAAIVLLPVWAAAVLALACLFLLAQYSMSGNYFMQTLCLTPMLLIFATLGDEQKGITYTEERVFFTLVGVAIGVAAALLLDRWDRAAGDVGVTQT